MNEEMFDLSRRAVACRGWRWMPGMLALPTRGMVSVPVRLTDERHPSHPDEYEWPHDLGLRVPNLSDAATLGCLLALVREAWGDLEAHLALGAAGWVLLSGESRVATIVYPTKPGITEAEALVNALENGP